MKLSNLHLAAEVNYFSHVGEMFYTQTKYEQHWAPSNRGYATNPTRTHVTADGAPY